MPTKVRLTAEEYERNWVQWDRDARHPVPPRPRGHVITLLVIAAAMVLVGVTL